MFTFTTIKNFLIKIKLWKKFANVTVQVYKQKKHFAAINKKAKKISLIFFRRFVVTEFVKTCDELVIGLE